MSSPYDIEANPPSVELLAVATEELRETPEIRAAAIAELRKLLISSTELNFPDDEDFLLIFLRPTKFYVQSTFKLMCNMKKFTTTHSSILANLMPADVKDALVEHGLANILTNRDQNGRRIAILHGGSKWDPKHVHEDQFLRMIYTLQKILVLEPATQINGVVVIFDYKGMGMSQVKATTAGAAKRLLTWIQEAAPLRVKGVHFVNEPAVFNIVWALTKPFLKEKLSKRVVFHGEKMTKLHKYIDPSCLPADYGGSLPALTYEGKNWYPAVEKCGDFIKKWNACGL